MTTRKLIYFGLSLICAIGALVIFFRGLDIKALLFLLLGVGAVVFFQLGISVKDVGKK